MRKSARIPLEQLRPHLVEIQAPRPGKPAQSEVPLPLEWPSLFGNLHPVEIEVGFGKGLFLLHAGAANPDTNFFGIEIERKYTLLTAGRLLRRGLANVKVTSCDARWLFREGIRSESVAGLHIYFPDPWWKTRHRKRRLFTADFARDCHRVLRPGGLLNFVSDVEEYFKETATMLNQLGGLVEQPSPSVKEPEDDLDYLTNFERKYRKEGRPIYRGIWRKR